jgi:hypothetical protein
LQPLETVGCTTNKPLISKSFLLLFRKKEDLPYCPFARTAMAMPMPAMAACLMVCILRISYYMNWLSDQAAPGSTADVVDPIAPRGTADAAAGHPRGGEAAGG